MRISPEKRFLAKIKKNGNCWNWKGKKLAKSPNNYGRFWIDGHWILAHRASYMFFVGLIPGNMQVLHKCDNPPCVNPDHLFLGTQQDNIRDMCNKKRQNSPKGENSNMAKLREVDVINIRAIHKYCKCTYVNLAQMYKVTPRTIRLAVLKETWAHV